MQVPFHNAYNGNRRFPPPNNLPWRPNFIPRGPPSRFRGTTPHWRQPSPQEHTNEFWCETCDRGFHTQDILEKHKQQHQKCNIDGCQFIAHPKVITKHIQMQHSSGLYKKIAKLQDPEEIRKWREERKKKYPTKENVEKAAAAIKEKIERGEKMGLKNKRHEKNLNTNPGIDGKRKPFNRHHTSTHVDQNSASNAKRRKMSHKNTPKTMPVPEDTRKLKAFAGIQELIMDTDELEDEPVCGFTIDDEDDVETASIPSEAPSGSVCHALSSLMCNYGSSDEDECDNANVPSISVSHAKVTNVRSATHTNESTDTNAPTATHINKSIDSNSLGQTPDVKDLPEANNIKRQIYIPNKNGSDEDCGPEEVKVTRQATNDPEKSEVKPFINKRKLKEKIPQKPVFKRPKPKLPSTLLQKLLFKEMKHERNIVLQCIRHIIRNNFFHKSV